MPKILDWLKDKNITHEDAMKFLEEKYKPELLSEDEKEKRQKEKEIDKPETPITPPEAPVIPPISATPEQILSDKLDPKSMADIQKTISDGISKEIQKQIGLLRGNPPKGVESENPVDKPTITKNLFEVRI